MIEKWKLALKEFLKKYEDDDEVVGAILYGDYLFDDYNDDSIIKIQFVIKDSCTYNKTGFTESNSFIINYSFDTKSNLYNKLKKDYFNNKDTTSKILSYGKIIYDLDDSIKELQQKALEYIDRSLNNISNEKKDLNNYQIWVISKELKKALNENSLTFSIVYYKLLEKIYDCYCENFCLIKIPIFNVYKAFKSEKYRKENYIFNLPDEEFIKLFLNCYKDNSYDVMYKNISKLTDYYYKRIGGFNIRLFEIEKEDMKEGILL